MSFDFIAKVILISASGALTPGPLTAATATIGVKRGWTSGVLAALGHMIVELPLIALIGFGVLVALKEGVVSSILALAGGGFLLFFGFLTLKDALRPYSLSTSKVKASRYYENPLVIGIMLSALNPFFIIWWFGVGSPLIYEALSLWSFQGIALMYVSHVWLDFAWLPIIAYLASLGRLNMKFLRFLLIALALAVLYFGVSFMKEGISSLMAMKLT
ncbi:MAG: LysE family transporter [Candidatus Nezhaarchaeales archaeon]